MNEILLDVQDLRTVYKTIAGDIVAVDGVSFRVYKGETLAIVGESGSGKSQTAFSILRLIPQPPGKIEKGRVFFKGKNLLELKNEDLQKVRGNEISIIFQEPMTSLNPVHTAGRQIAEVLELHQGLNKKKALQKAVEMLKIVGIPDPQQRINEYPHQLSGGMRQRVMIAMALACKPSLLIADEPTTALDVTIQAQILAEMQRLKDKFTMSIMLITHDLGVVAGMADRVVVMYAGQVVEVNDIRSLFKKPIHPYTIGLLESIPKMDQDNEWLEVIDGNVPDPLLMPKGCRFNPRCKYVTKKCLTEMPPLITIANDVSYRCWYPHNLTKGGSKSE
ncbi:ABC transporter ATP-binding protein [Clostridium sp. 'deep sea']|uniref:ABC transporter ATP-binding protein n=1 Tax=Clostridium sp. 'deep sea' TaxID=2779445 RepID=UPI0018966B56|nr:ABC transporter ATP-binding protein [Clostridium sp. 'deep sea']QOR34375.1 ABC transporter ATP-binding protein [Clostridium sp. 'deep sea']